jgi:RNA polymerase sigma factor (sigma-70 family)
MVWRETFPPASEQALDVEAERERRLIAQARAGADWALTALIARYQPTVTRYLTRLCGDSGRARALAERVFQRMERRLHGPHGGDNLRLWLLRASTEAGLEALRRPQRAQTPRLGSSPISGLLPAEGGSGPQRALRGGISRLRNVVGVVSRQARPLIWQEPRATSRASEANQDERARETRAAAELGPVDESLDAIEPSEALRHQLIRATLAELPYGDAQCLALHLVAGLNQAEVARALGITGSAARKRIVQGLSQFSERYQTAVQSLSLPTELGYGDALPKAPKVEALDTAPAPAPVIVPEEPEELEPGMAGMAGMAQSAPPTIPLALDARDEDSATSLGATYYVGESLEDPSSPSIKPTGSSQFVCDEEPEFDTLSAGIASTESATSAFTLAESSAHVAVMTDEPEETLPFVEADMASSHQVDEPPAGAGIVTRIAADAIVGPVVDALPVHSEPLALAPSYNSPGSRSIPLAYELTSGDGESGDNPMSWLDTPGLMEPLSFEAIATSAPASAESQEDDDPWMRSTVLELESPVELAPSSMTDSITGEEPIPPTGAEEAFDVSLPPMDLSIALDEGDYGWERSYHGVTLEHDDAPLDCEAFPLIGQVPAPDLFFDEPALDQTPKQGDMETQQAAPDAQTLEELWEDTPDTYGR